MFRVGVYTGKIYSIDQNINSLGECCMTLEDNATVRQVMYFKNIFHKKCKYCDGCEKAKADI